MTKDEFLLRANDIHQSKYQYKLDKDEYHTKEYVIAICPEHQEFKVLINNHLSRKSGCKLCGQKSSSEKQIKTWTKQEFLAECKFENINYDLLPDEFDSKTILSLKCNIHNVQFNQRPFNHIAAKHSGCKLCAADYLSSIKLPKLQEFIDKANLVHNFKYDYSEITEYKGNKKKVTIRCPIHGPWQTRPDNHINRKSGCRICALEAREPVFVSSQEIKIREYLDSINVSYINSDRRLLNGYELDLFIPEHNLAIEINGIYWHSDKHKPNPDSHTFKMELLEKKGIKLLQFYDVEIDECFEFVKRIIDENVSNNKNICKDKILNRRFYSILDYPNADIEKPSKDLINRWSIWNAGYLINTNPH